MFARDAAVCALAMALSGERALERGGQVVGGPKGRFRAAVVPAGADVHDIDATLVLVVERDGSVTVQPLE